MKIRDGDRTSSFTNDLLTKSIIRAGMRVHQRLGPGLLESTYRQCICYELGRSGIATLVEPLVPLKYDDLVIAHAFRPDIIVGGQVIVELKHVERLLAVHEAQLRTYLKLSRLNRGLLLNFNVSVLKHGIRRIEVSGYSPSLPSPCPA